MRKRPVSWFIGLALLASGLGLIGYTIFQVTVVENQLAGEQQDAASNQSSVADASDPNKPYEAPIFGRIFIPRLGDGWVRYVAEGVKWEPMLNKIGIGHYPGTAMPGEEGNFAVAAHRGGFGGTFKNIHRLQAGDHVYVETADGRYDYVYRQTKIVLPSEVGVIHAVPEGMIGAHAGGKYMTLTSCEPIFVNTHRIIVWLELADKG